MIVWQDGASFRAALSAMTRGVAPGERVAITTDLSSEASVTSATMLLSLDKRSGQPRLCVDGPSWDIAYTEAYKCSATRAAVVRSLQITSADTGPTVAILPRTSVRMQCDSGACEVR
jgi:hypothetical protein